MRFAYLALALALLVSTPLGAKRPSDTLSYYADQIRKAEALASPSARKVMSIARFMVSNSEIIRGSCWNWLNTAYLRAGYPSKKRKVIFSSRISGPYARLSLLQPGDWIYHVNHSYHNIEHSGMFIGWLNQKRHIALMLSYGGEGRRKPGRYRPYDISHTYRITRPKEH